MQTMHRAYNIYYMRLKIQPNVAFAVFLFFRSVSWNPAVDALQYKFAIIMKNHLAFSPKSSLNKYSFINLSDTL
jgi:hypothetical protein